MRVLVVEDEDAIAGPLIDGLTREGFSVTRVATGRAALAAAVPDIVLLDMRLPDMDGLDVCRSLRSVSDVPIIIVSARGEEVDRIVGLEVGADDYVVKPYGIRELVARMRAVLRRRHAPTSTVIDGPGPAGAAGSANKSGSGGTTAGDGLIEAGVIVIDRARHIVVCDGREVDLTNIEFEVLTYIAQAGGTVVSRRDLMADVWGSAWYGPTKTIDMHVAHLRQKLGNPGYIETVRGIGFRLGASALNENR
ncbi:MAG: response regulator transcription factor [Thermoleophilia bacterium]|nr:response regulator transcription factor [Thermoleophilia bacterium]